MSHGPPSRSPPSGATGPGEAVTIVRLALALALGGLASGAAADDPYTPPHMVFGPSQTAPAPAGPDPVAVSTVADRTGLGLALLVGQYTRPSTPGFSGSDVEAYLLADLGRWTAGGMLSLGTIGSALAAVGGARLGLGSAYRIDLLADLGVAFPGAYGDGTRPLAGLRAGLTWVRSPRGGDLTLGVAVRYRVPERGAVPDPSCSLVGASCPTVQGDVGGGTLAGAFLSWGGAPDQRR